MFYCCKSRDCFIHNSRGFSEVQYPFRAKRQSRDPNSGPLLAIRSLIADWLSQVTRTSSQWSSRYHSARQSQSLSGKRGNCGSSSCCCCSRPKPRTSDILAPDDVSLDRVEPHQPVMVYMRLAKSFNNRDKYRERFDIPDHPLWESLQLHHKCSSTSMRKYMAKSETTNDSNQTSDRPDSTNVAPVQPDMRRP